MIKVAPHTFSVMSQDDLNALKASIKRAYPGSHLADKRKREYVSLACQPTAAVQFMANVIRILGPEPKEAI